MRTKYKPWAKPYIEEHTEVTYPVDKLNELDNLYLEIGSGKGDFIVQMAKNNPNLFFLGIEKNITCGGFMAKKLAENELSNAKMIADDAERLLPNLKDKSVNTLFLNFSDPWPKKRHHKRRLTASKFLDEYVRILKDDGKMIFKTDNVDLFNDSIETIEESLLKIISLDRDYDGNEPFDAITEYEAFFRNEGTKINRMVVVKR